MSTPDTEQRAYQVHPSQLRRAMSNLSRQGANVEGYRTVSPTVSIIVVQVPLDAPPLDWQQAPPPRRQFWPPSDWRRAVMALCVVAIIAGLAWTAYSVHAGNVAQEVSQQGGIAGLLADIRWPWQAAQEAIDSVRSTVSAALWVGGALALLLALLLLRGIIRR